MTRLRVDFGTLFQQQTDGFISSAHGGMEQGSIPARIRYFNVRAALEKQLHHFEMTTNCGVGE